MKTLWYMCVFMEVLTKSGELDMLRDTVVGCEIDGLCIPQGNQVHLVEPSPIFMRHVSIPEL